jgi:hypothetical protein
MGDDGWRFCSFSRRHRSFVDPSTLDMGSIGFRRKLDCGTAFLCSYFEHGQCQWSLRGCGQQCPWDSVDVAGVLIWQGKPKELRKTAELRRESAAAFLAEYTDWCNGACYWFSVVEVDEDGDEIRELDSCGGFIGEEYLLQCIRDTLADVGEDEDVEVVGDAAWIGQGLRGGLSAEVAEARRVAASIGGAI